MWNIQLNIEETELPIEKTLYRIRENNRDKEIIFKRLGIKGKYSHWLEPNGTNFHIEGRERASGGRIIHTETNIRIG